jgi:hypothetical protein
MAEIKNITDSQSCNLKIEALFFNLPKSRLKLTPLNILQFLRSTFGKFGDKTNQRGCVAEETASATLAKEEETNELFSNISV